jgi:hypothetical protein
MALKSFIIAVAVSIPALAFADSAVTHSGCKSTTASCQSAAKKHRAMNARAQMQASAAEIYGGDANSMYGSNSAANNHDGRTSGGGDSGGGGAGGGGAE